ncbi:hypothetical protein K788_0002350 [Paraburkholderia caribensis MBA4]|uniref:Uncharacterized protein n=1 Tax=Paraburkholderia caribensis MBA4 TaxID=1323664 RepID=A0A0P0R929_9BURK|nr:hypothetical protein K788_0002350 [Paraburkholderia caribensis MBA4]
MSERPGLLFHWLLLLAMGVALESPAKTRRQEATQTNFHPLSV